MNFFNLYATLCLVLTILYTFFMRLYAHYWQKLPVFQPQLLSENTKIKVSVLVPARNEAENIELCLSHILANDYPRDLFEIIVIDDHSTDDTAARAAQFDPDLVKVLQLKDYLQNIENQSFKKKAIETAIAHAQGDFILVTDADCKVPRQWITLMVAFYTQQNKRFIAAPVNFQDEKSDFERFQSLDFIGMMGITGAGVAGNFTHMCNGANLAYEKKLFYEVGGFKGIDHVASGDDMLLMQKIARYFPDAIGFLKNPDATVFTSAKPNFSEFLSQRRRWASKSSSYTEYFTTFQLAIVFLFCVSLVVNSGLLLFWGRKIIYILMLQLTVKFAVDYVFLNTMTQFFDRKDLMKRFFKAQFWHVFYITIIGFVANIKKKYVWKERVVQ
jgi:cellulose synthase/poly-beta-1,6-N-acetylglucosamine synthase-like glycosyltransferase